MSCFGSAFIVETSGNADIADISDSVLEIVALSGFTNGIVLVCRVLRLQ